MTIAEMFKEKLVSNGMFPNQAEEVINMCREASGDMKSDFQDMKHRWNDPFTDYPAPMIVFLWMGVRRKALEWIDTNIPKAWFRGMFVD